MNIVTEYGLTNNCMLEYFGTLYEIAYSFCCDGEKILRQNGFRNRSWVESLFKIAADNHCFITPKCLSGLPFNAIRHFITQAIVADFCLANDILEATFYEYQLHQQYQKLSRLCLKLTNATLKDLRIARRKFHKCKIKYINLAYGPDPPEDIMRAFDVYAVCRDNKLQQSVMVALELMPIFFQLCPRDENAIDAIPMRKLCNKYIRLFNICAEFEELI